jgi:hypothetical protein
MSNLYRYVFTAEIISLLWIADLFAYGPSMVWEKTYGPYAAGLSVLETSDGGYIAIGSIGSSNAIRDIWLLKTDQNGDTL